MSYSDIIYDSFITLTIDDVSTQNHRYVTDRNLSWLKGKLKFMPAPPNFMEAKNTTLSCVDKTLHE